MRSEMKIVVPRNFRDFGRRVNNNINLIRNNGINSNYIFEPDLIRFNNGEGKALLIESVRDKDLYILTDVANYDITYESQRGTHHMMPDEHYQDIKRILGAACGHADKVTLIMPLLYQSRQDKKSNRESLDCAIALRELEQAGVDEFITFDAHNPAVYNAIPFTPFENFYPTDDLLVELLSEEDISPSDVLVVSPDEGAANRARLYADLLGNVDFGMFYKQRDYTRLVDGKHPIVAHRYLGNETSIDGKAAIIVDDMIASGGSIIDTARQLKARNAGKVYLMVSFALFTKGIEEFKEAYYEGVFDRVYSTNLTYVPEEIINEPWYHHVDCSMKVAHVINALNNGESIKRLLNGKEDTVAKIRKLKK